MKMLVTAGPTREAIDPVRFLSNPSTGKMGYAIAERAVARGHTVRLVSGPVALPPPEDVDLVNVVSAADMLKQVENSLAWCDVLIMSAAVADWRPVAFSGHKLKKDTMSGELRLERTADILKTVAPRKRQDQCFVGFAAETSDVEAEARRKLLAKALDLVVANDVTQPGAGFASDSNQVWLVSAEGTQALPLMSKHAVAGRILDWVDARVARVK